MRQRQDGAPAETKRSGEAESAGMGRRLFVNAITFGFCCLGAMGYLRAEVPISVLRDMQDKASEALWINVLSVDQQLKRRELEEGSGEKVIEETALVTVSARVQTILRSASGLVPHTFITIRYEVTRRTPPVPGASPPATPKSGETLRAYLNKVNGSETYSPAALSQSFVK